MRLGYLGIALVYLALSGAEVTLHWYVGAYDFEPAHRLQEKYLYQDPDNGKRYIAGLVDFVIPTVILGLAAGIIGSRWTPGGLAFCVLLLSLGVVVLWPVYEALVPRLDPVWFGAKLEDRVRFLLFGPPRVLALCSVSACGAYLMTQHFRQRGPLR